MVEDLQLVMAIVFRPSWKLTIANTRRRRYGIQRTEVGTSEEFDAGERASLKQSFQAMAQESMMEKSGVKITLNHIFSPSGAVRHESMQMAVGMWHLNVSCMRVESGNTTSIW